MKLLIEIEVISVLLIFLINFTSGDVTQLQERYRNIIKPLDAIQEPLNNASPPGQIHYSVANLSQNFKSNSKFQARGMAHLYMLTNRFIQLVAKDEAFPDRALQITDENTIRIADIGREWPDWLRHYGASLSVVLTAALFATLMPIIGLTFCCCRCVGRCGARSQPFDKRYDPCRRHFYGAILVIISVLLSFGVICAFTTNEVLEEGVTNLPEHVRIALTDTELYLNNTEEEFRTLLVTNFNELRKSLSDTLHDSGKIILDKLAQETKASVLSNLTNIVDGLGLIKDDLSTINNLTEKLLMDSSLLDVGLKTIRNQIATDIESCQREIVCREFKIKFRKVNELSVEANFSQLPNVTASIQNLSELTATGIEKEVMNGKTEFEKIQSNIQEAVGNYIPLIMRNINETGQGIEKEANQIISILEKMKAVIREHILHPVTGGQKIISEYSPYRYYICFGASCALLVVLICLTFGLLCGCCGTRPSSGYQDDCCNKGAGSRYLMLAVWLMFLSSGVLMTLALIYFMAGVTVDKAICHPLKNPHNSRVFSLIDQIANVDRFYKSSRIDEEYTVNLSMIINTCHKNESIHQVLRLKKLIDIPEIKIYLTNSHINDTIQQLVENIRLDYDLNIITPNASRLLLNLAHSKLSNINFRAYTNMISTNITSINLIELSKAISDLAVKLPSNKYKEITLRLQNNARYLRTHQEQVDEMTKTMKDLESIANKLEEHLKFNHTSLKNAIEYLLVEVQKAQSKLREEGQIIVTKLAKDFGSEFLDHINEYVEKVISRTQYEIGRCWPVSQAYNATVVAGCNRILSPFNGFWFSIGAAASLFVPAIIVSVILSNLYQKSDPYPGPLVEAEYLYDVYGGDRDNVPLASVSDKKKKKNRRSTDESCSNNAHSSGNNSGSAGGATGNADRARSRHNPVSALPPLGSPPIVSSAVPLNSSAPVVASQIVNLEEIAPKQRWDFPANNTQSAEYERPPPYYYPGPTPQGGMSE